MADTPTLRRIPSTTVIPFLAVVVLALTWGRSPGPLVVALAAALLAAAVLAAVHHAEVAAHRVGEPFGSIILAVAVTVIEVGLILTLMSSGGEKSASLARDTVFRARDDHLQRHPGPVDHRQLAPLRLQPLQRRGHRRLATVAVLTGTCLVLPTFTLGATGPSFTATQLGFAAVASLALYAMFIVTQTWRHRDFFLPVSADGTVLDEDEHADPPTSRQALQSLGLLVLALVSVVGLAKVESPAIESGVAAAGLPASFVGVVIALLVLAPESLAAVRAARRGLTQTSLNLALGSAMASVGLTIPAIALASIWLEGPLVLGLGATQLVLLAMTVVVGVLTIVPGRATRLQGGVHLVLLAAYVFLAADP